MKDTLKYQTDQRNDDGRVRRIDADSLMTTLEVAELCRVSKTYLEALRRDGAGPAYIRLSGEYYGRIRYRRGDVLAWLESRKTQPKH